MKCHDSSCSASPGPLHPRPSFRPKPPNGRRSGGIPSQDPGSCRTVRAGIPPFAPLSRNDGEGASGRMKGRIDGNGLYSCIFDLSFKLCFLVFQRVTDLDRPVYLSCFLHAPSPAAWWNGRPAGRCGKIYVHIMFHRGESSDFPATAPCRASARTARRPCRAVPHRHFDRSEAACPERSRRGRLRAGAPVEMTGRGERGLRPG